MLLQQMLELIRLSLDLWASSCTEYESIKMVLWDIMDNDVFSIKEEFKLFFWSQRYENLQIWIPKQMFTYNWMSYEATDYKAVKKNAKDSQNTQNGQNKVLVPNNYSNYPRKIVTMFTGILISHDTFLFVYFKILRYLREKRYSMSQKRRLILNVFK